MAKIGRNDPCPCGSGKKYKKCCHGKGSGKPKNASNGTTSSTSFQQAKHMAEQWLGQTALGKAGQKKKMSLVLDRYTLTEPGAVAKVKALGKESDGRVQFYEGQQLIGEADFSAPGHLLLTTADKKHSKRLQKMLGRIHGLEFQDRTVDEYDADDTVDPAQVAAEMLDFKKRFFKAWMDEKNERLSGHTPREAAQLPELKPELVTLVKELEERELKLPKKDRFRFGPIKNALGL